MDNRLQRAFGSRLERLTDVDLPDLARAIVAFQRHRCGVASGKTGSVGYVHFVGDGLNVMVRADDWAKILPYVEDGSLDPKVVPVAHVMEVSNTIQYDPGYLDYRDTEFYERVLNLLKSLFTVEFPKSNI